MKQPYADVLDDYFDALLEETPSQALAPVAELQPEPQLQAKAEPVPAPLVPYAEPSEAQRRQALEALLAQVAALKEEEVAASELETQTLPQTQTQVQAEPLTPPDVAPEVTIPEIAIPEIAVAAPVAAVITAPELAPPAIAVASEIATETVVASEVKTALNHDAQQQAQLAAEQALATQAAAWRNMETEHSFQVLFFEVAGMTFAVPLTHLGGIYQVSKLTSLFGKPHWFAGVQTERDRQIYAVDTARWAMPGHTAQEEYSYLVTLGESNWGLGCHQLKGTALLTRDQVKWRSTPGARPWLAGMVKERMCALLHVDALIALLEQGKNIDGQQV